MTPRRAATEASLLCLMLGGWCAPAGRADPAPQAYDAALAGAQQALLRESARLQHAPPRTVDSVPPEAVARLRLDTFHAVQAPGQAPQPVNNTVLLQQIHSASLLRDARARGAAYAQAAQQIAALRRALAEAPRAAGSVVTGAEAQARAMLGRAEFASDPLPPPSLFDRFMRWLSRLFTPKRASAGPAPSINPQFVKGLLLVLGAGALAVLVAMLAQWLRQRPRRTALALDETEAALVEARDADSLRALAEQQARQGAWRRAFRLTYLATLVMLDTNGTLRFDRSKTNWEYLRALRAAGRGDIYQSMTPFTREFDRVWYGVAQATADDYAYAAAQFDALRASSPSAGAVTPPAAPV